MTQKSIKNRAQKSHLVIKPRPRKKVKIVLVMVTTLDGVIAKHRKHFVNWSSKEDKAAFRKITKQAGVVIIGQRTYNLLKNPLPNRLHIVVTRDNKKDTEHTKFMNDPTKIIHLLDAKGYKQATLVGGAQINTLFLKKKLIDEILLTIEPRLFGQGLLMFTEDCNIQLQLLKKNMLNKHTIQLRYKVVY